VTIEFHIDPERSGEFVQATQGLRAIHLRDGAVRWELFQDTADKGHYVVTFVVESWVEHLRQHERLTKADQEALDRVYAFNKSGDPVVSHFIAR
jgi:quinol monooxygenase YgiN